jgi:hypothetical protein
MTRAAMQSIAENGQPVTLEKLEQCLDRLAVIMEHPAIVAERMLPLWERLEREIALRQKSDDKLAAARDRARRLKGRTAAPSC